MKATDQDELEELVNQTKGWVELEKLRVRPPKRKISVVGRLVLINSVLTSLPIFMLLIFRTSKGVLKKLDYYRSRFFWKYDEHKKNIGLLDEIF